MEADNAGPAGGAEGPAAVPSAKTKKRRSGLFYRIWRGIFGRGSEDYEKRLQYLSKEEAAVQARMKRRAATSMRVVRYLIALSVILEVFAVVYAIMTTRTEYLNWQMRAMRVLPMLVLPGLSSVFHSTFASFRRKFDHMDQKKIERLRTERKAKIDELKEKTNYYFTQQLIEKYDLDPAARATAATVLASKLGEESGSKVSVVDEQPKSSAPVMKSIGVDPIETNGLRNRKQSHTISTSTGSTVIPKSSSGTPDVVRVEGQEIPSLTQVVVEHYKGSASYNGNWISCIVSLLVRDNPSESYALICDNCYIHNGLARKEDYPHIRYYCPRCHALNTYSQSGELDSNSSAARSTVD
ncbi:hypothetical protein Cni_G18547 [Canna indica]|uniref:Lunapark zinc ribbon domain-containing protein n=1 Tax=Canna indica TaxID=4628 RepID=A0AAQ3QG63_9LILI|nr:hypothetical protein Cni_G18547 [Canna indica]